MIDPQLLELLVCPRCKGELVLAGDSEALICPACMVQYPVREGIPIMLIDEAQPVEALPSDRAS